MRVLYVSGDAVGGVRKHVHEILNHARSFNVEPYYFFSDRLDLKAIEDLKTFENSGLVMQRCTMPKKPSFLDVVNIVKLIRFAKINNIQLIHSHGSKGGLYGRVASIFLKVPVVHTPHGGVLHNAFGFFEQKIFLFVEWVLSFLTSLFIFESNYSKNRFLELVRKIVDKKILVNFNGIEDLEKFTLIESFPSKNPVLTCVGMLRSIKGQDVLIKAVKTLKDNGFFFDLNIIGDGPNANNLKKLVQDLSLTEQVLFHGEISNVSDFIKKSDAIVIPSRFESFGYVALEAFSCEKPVIASNTGGLIEVLDFGKAGFLFEKENHFDLADKIKSVFLKKEETEKKITHASFLVKNLFSLKLSLKNLFGAYYRLLEKNINS